MRFYQKIFSFPSGFGAVALIHSTSRCLRSFLSYSTSKELISYHKELEQQKAKVAKMRENNADEYDIKKQVSPPLFFRSSLTVGKERE
jgi:hypothetical protein